ncbi:MAG: hypothetical protein HY812_10850 [Planctomycetes bacterium]|nr:hypothetical protein [Planctomycetota bacterium]
MNSPAKRRRSPRRREGGSIVDELPSPPPEDLSDTDTLEFLRAIDAFKRSTGRNFPTWTEVLEILRSLGYRKAGKADRGA